MTALPHIQYFLGANAPTGFYSLYPELIHPETARAIYILKGGPGCGKSTLMRRIGARMEEEGFDTEYILCSGDPDSLDALMLPQLNVALVDGTAPHVVEPKYPGVVERYVNLGDCYQSDALADLRPDIMACMSGCKSCYQRAYRCLGASAEVFEDMRSTLLTDALSKKLAKRAHGILSRELKPKKGAGTGKIKQRFLGAVTHKGPMCLFDTALAQCPRVYELVDNYSLAHEMLIHLLSGAVAGGYDVVACSDPMAPDHLAHLLVPEAGLAFLTSTDSLSFPGKPYRRIRLDAAAGSELLRRNRPRLRFARKVSAALMEEAVDSLAQAKAIHDELEALYNPFVDFSLVEQIAQTIGDKILK
ncbi:MAG: hypothetical protein AB7E30_09065 [Lawsonibacter sp.]